MDRKKYIVKGIVQGVGFRPFIFNLASSLNLSGFVFNSPAGVVIEAEGLESDLDDFTRRIPAEAPVLSRIISFSTTRIPVTNQPGFIILKSEENESNDTLIAPDVALCDNCYREMMNPQDRRHRYPFINCTDCGPRFSIVSSVPYDRANTSMRKFPLCPACREEYEDPGNRRFHAQPNACPVCGPSLDLVPGNDNLKSVSSGADSPDTDHQAAARAREVLKKGEILAIRGIGGFHLAVNAVNSQAVQRLRDRKGREEKPFALMAANLEAVKRICLVSEAEAQVLQGWQRPIVLLKKSGGGEIAPEVAPENSDYGVMLPYAPLHHLMLDETLPYLVMTSGNYTDEPIAISNREAMDRLNGISDWFLLHNRDILQRCDDSIVRVIDQKRLAILRRSRGFVPYPVFIGGKAEEHILACGPELKNTIAFLRDDQVFLSQHIGDLDNPEAFKFYRHCIDHLGKILRIEPSCLAYDLHPEYLSSKWALEQDLPAVGVQHHHAHLASVLADNHAEGPAIGIILDGTGYGEDGTIWGGEILAGDASAFRRISWLKPFRLPGGAMAVRQPWRIALSLLYREFGEEFRSLPLEFLAGTDDQTIGNLITMTRSGFNSPLTSSCGRLFDAVSAMLGIKPVIAYEAQAAIALQMAAHEDEKGIYREAVNSVAGTGPIDLNVLLRRILDDIVSGSAKGTVSARFHNTLAEMFTRAAVEARKETGLGRAALSGGVFQNLLFSSRLESSLEREGFEVLSHIQVPTNDGGVSLGQAAVAEKMIRSGKKSRIEG